MALGVSEGHLSRLFKEVTEINFLGYLNAYRINKSVELLQNPRSTSQTCVPFQGSLLLGISQNFSGDFII